jgi:Ca-activated chloride channel family protein
MNTPLPPLEELEKLPLYELISLLDDVQVPEPVSYFPVTPIWTWIFGIAALIILFLLYKVWRRWKREQYRKLACHELERTASVKGPAYVMKVSQILKWTALAAYPRKSVAGLEGLDWLRFLDSTSEGTEFTEGAGRSLASSQYRRNADVEEDALGALAKKWIITHQRGVLS